MKENPRQTVGNLEKRFLDIIKPSIGIAPKNIEEQMSLELHNIYLELQSIRDRRKELLYKSQLKSNEYDELKLLNEIMKDVADLQSLIKDFGVSFHIEKQAILGTKNLKFLLNLGKENKISNQDIFSALHIDSLDIRSHNPELEALKLLQLTDDDVEKISFVAINIFLMLEYCSLTKHQKEYLLDKVVLEKACEDDVNFFSLFLSRFPLGSIRQEKMIQAMEQTARYFPEAIKQSIDDPFGKHEHDTGPIVLNDSFHNMVSHFFETDILKSPFLSSEQKTRIGRCLVILGSPLDCTWLTKNYPQYLDEESRKIADQKIKNSPRTQELKMQSFYEASPSILEGKKIQFITHPLFDIFNDNGTFKHKLWKEAQGNPKKYLELHMIALMKERIEMNKEIEKHGEMWTGDDRFIDIIRIQRELEKYEKIASQKDTVTVFLMPKKYEATEKEESNTAFYRLLSSFKGDNENVFYMETARTDAGDMKEGDAEFLNKILPPKGEILSTGGYIGLCLNGTSEQLQRLNGKRRITIDFSESNDSGGYTLNSKLYKLPPPKLPKNPDAVHTYSDVQKILEENKGCIDAYDKAIFEQHVNYKTYDDPEEPEFYFQNQR